MKPQALLPWAAAMAILVAGTVWAQSDTPAKPATTATQTTPAPDPRVDKILQQNEQILKNQQEILQRLERIENGINQMRRRSS